jgi:hypothetical protein
MTGEPTSFRDGFAEGRLDPERWVAAYLPHWTTPERSAARYHFEAARLVLEITSDTEPWCPEHDGDTRVSSIQTGVFSAPVGSVIGQHRFSDGVTVVTPQETRRLCVATYGRIAIRAAALADPRAMVALWMIGFEEVPEESGEICVMEIFGRDVRRDGVAVGMGVHPHRDPHLVDDFERVDLAVDVTKPHEYVASWTDEGIAWAVDGREVRRTTQSPAYGMQLMLGIYAFEPLKPGEGPLRFVVEDVRVDPA